MAYVIAEPCIGVKDTACVDACPVDCIHPKKDESDFETRHNYTSIPRNASIVAPACRFVRSPRSLHSMTCPPNGASSRKSTRSTIGKLRRIDA